MAKNKILYIVAAVLVLVIIGGGLFLFLGNKGAQKEVGIEQEEPIVNCSGKGFQCFIDRMNMCLPVTAATTSNGIIIELTVLGVENEKCHFKRKINNTIELDCYFPKGILSEDIIRQTLKIDEGLQKVVDDACSGL